MSLFKSKDLDSEVLEYLEQDLDDYMWLEDHIRSLKNKSYEDILDLTSDKIKSLNKILKKLR